MTDNVQTNPGTGGAVFATDEFGGVHYPIVKVSFGAADAAIVVADTNGFRLPVTDPLNAVLFGAVTETAPASDTASSGLNGRLQRIAQRLSSLIGLLPAALTGSGNLKISVSENAIGLALDTSVLGLQVAQGSTTSGQNGMLMLGAVSAGPTYSVGQSSPLSLTTNGYLRIAISSGSVGLDATAQGLLGALTETAPASDTASSGLNGRLQRVAQRLTSLIALLPAALTGSGNLKVSLQESTADQNVKLKDGSANALTSKSVGSERAITVAIVDGSGNQVTTFGGAGGTSSNVGSAVPAAATAAGFSDGTNLQLSRVYDLDSGAGTEYAQGVNLRQIKSGGSVEAGIPANPLSVLSATADVLVGAVTETAPASDTASSGLNGRLQRIAQRITSLIALVPAALTGSGNFKVSIAESTATVTVSGTVTSNAGTNLNTSLLALETTQTAGNTLLGAVTETAPASDTASSGLNGRLQRIAQRLSSLIALIPTALTGSGNFKIALQESALATATAFSDANRFPVEQRDTLAVAGSVTSAATLFTQDMTGYESITIQTTSAGTSCIISYETSDNNTNWVDAYGVNVSGGGDFYATNLTNALGMVRFSRLGRYFRARVSTYGSGTVTVAGNLSKAPCSNIHAFPYGVALDASVVAGNTLLGAVNETAPASDTASSGLNGRLQRIAQRITSLIALVPAALTGSGNFKVSIQESTATVTVSGTVAVSNSFALETTQTANGVLLGAVTETAPASDTASSGLNGRLQRVAQRLTSLIGLLPSSLTGSGNLKVSISEATTAILPTMEESNSIGIAGTATTVKFVAIAASTSGNNTLIAAVNPKKLRVLAVYLSSNGTVNSKFQSGAGGTDLTGLTYMIANSGMVLPFNPKGWFETASNTLLNLNLSAAIAVGGTLVYVEV